MKPGWWGKETEEARKDGRRSSVDGEGLNGSILAQCEAGIVCRLESESWANDLELCLVTNGSYRWFYVGEMGSRGQVLST